MRSFRSRVIESTKVCGSVDVDVDARARMRRSTFKTMARGCVIVLRSRPAFPCLLALLSSASSSCPCSLLQELKTFNPLLVRERGKGRRCGHCGNLKWKKANNNAGTRQRSVFRRWRTKLNCFWATTGSARRCRLCLSLARGMREHHSPNVAAYPRGLVFRTEASI